MSSVDLSRRTPESTRGRIVAHLRRGASTVDELAQTVGMTDNAVRSHLTALERDGVVRQAGIRRGAGAGKPAILYDLHPAAELLFSKAYPPVLNAVLGTLIDELPSPQAEEILRQVGRRLAKEIGGEASGNLRERAESAASALIDLGGDVEVVEDSDGLSIRSYGCPLSAVVTCRPEVYRAMETLISEVTGAPTRECCERGDRPRCCFRISPDGEAAAMTE